MDLKIRARELTRQIAKKRLDQKKLEKQLAGIITKWRKKYNPFKTAAYQLARMKITAFGSKRYQALCKTIVEGFEIGISSDRTKERDELRAKIEAIQKDIQTLGAELVLVNEQQKSELKATDEIVTQVFALNKVAVEASTNRETYLTNHVFSRCIGEDGKVRKQVSFTSSDGLSRVVVMVNRITYVHGDLASRAMELISQFFDAFLKKGAEMDEYFQALYDISKQLLVEKISYKPGPDLYRYLSMKFNKSTFYELAEAQDLLRQSIRSDRTTPYIRIYERKSRADKWTVVNQS